MILPPMVAYTKNLASAKKALVNYLGVDCIQSCSIDEQYVFFTFQETEPTAQLKTVVDNLAYGIQFTYEGHQYNLQTQYFDL
jgi:hypothetical protein